MRRNLVFPGLPLPTAPAGCRLLAGLIITGALVSQACGDGTGPAHLATPATLTLTTAPPGSAQNRVAFNPRPVVQLRDANGAAVDQVGIVVTAAITAGGGALGGTTATTTTNTGAATFTDLSIAGTTGDKILTFSATGLASATATVTVTPAPRRTSPSMPATISRRSRAHRSPRRPRSRSPMQTPTQ